VPSRRSWQVNRLVGAAITPVVAAKLGKTVHGSEGRNIRFTAMTVCRVLLPRLFLPYSKLSIRPASSVCIAAERMANVILKE
jgi:hypothetical protein